MEEPLSPAQQELKVAKGYIDGYHEKEDDRDKKNYLRFAAERVERARKLDTKATYTFLNPRTKEEETWALSQFSAAVLFTEAQYLMRTRDHSSAIKSLLKALQFTPAEPLFLDELAEAYILNNQRGKAREVLASNTNPTMRTHELEDRLRTDRHLGSSLKPVTLIRILCGLVSIAGLATMNLILFFGGIVAFAAVNWLDNLDPPPTIPPPEKGPHDL